MERTNNTGMIPRYRFPVTEYENGDHIECASQSCRSCSAIMLADCVAVCCCPCAVVSFLAFSFVKAPWIVGRRWLGTLKRKKGLLHKRVGDAGESDGEMVVGIDLKAFKRKSKDNWSGELGVWEIGVGEYKNLNGRMSSKLDAEKVWMELYQVGHWGFGRISFSANPARDSLGKDAAV